MNSKYGQPQGNELVYGKDIIRRVDTFVFNTIDKFKSSKDAHSAYAAWMKENNCTSSNKQWNYMRPIVGWDNEPVTIDSWEKKK
jgi:hypothetical protein